MRPQRDIPPEWANRMVDLGFHYNGRPSARRLGDSVGITVNAVLRVIHRENWGDDTVAKVGEALRDPEFVWSWVGTPSGDAYEPPAASRMLTARQRGLIDELIRQLVREEGGVDEQAPTTQTSDAGVTPAQEEVARTVADTKPPKAVRTAARHGENEGKRLRQAQDMAGEESQDEEGH